MDGDGKQIAMLETHTPCSPDYSPSGCKFPVKGLRVSVFWEEFQEWYPATVLRWSGNKKTWVMKYDHWRDTVYEDVPTWKWRFL